MLIACVGAASSQGLAVLQPERDDTLSLVHQWIQDRPRRVGFWVVLGDTDARSVRALLLDGARMEAMLLLDRCAKDLGQILPGDLRPIHPH